MLFIFGTAAETSERRSAQTGRTAPAVDVGYGCGNPNINHD
jgi:hypothetical protein